MASVSKVYVEHSLQHLHFALARVLLTQILYHPPRNKGAAVTVGVHRDFILEVCKADSSHSLLFLRLGSKIHCKHAIHYLFVQAVCRGGNIGLNESLHRVSCLCQSYSATALWLKTPLASHLPGSGDCTAHRETPAGFWGKRQLLPQTASRSLLTHSSLSPFSEPEVKDRETAKIKKYFLKGAQVSNVMQVNTAGCDTEHKPLGNTVLFLCRRVYG